MKPDEKNKMTFDLKGKSIGRAASEVAVLLRGKNNPGFEPRIRSNVKILVLNAKDAKILPSKLRTKSYTRYSGYPSGLKRETMGDLFKRNPNEVFKKAVWGMLPKNRSRKELIKNLEFEN